MPQEIRDMQIPKIKAHYAAASEELNKETVLIDGGLVSMQLMLAARAHGYDTNAIGGYEKDQIAEAFGLDKERYAPVMLLSIGKAANSGYPSVRLPIEKVAQFR